MVKSKSKRVIYKNKSKRSKLKRSKSKRSKSKRSKSKRSKIQNGGNDFDVIHTVNITEYEGEIVTYGLVSCTSIFWHWKGKNYLVHTHSLQEGDASNAYNQALEKMKSLNVKKITIHVYYGRYKLNEEGFTSYCKDNGIIVNYKHYDARRILYFIGLTSEGILISSPMNNSTMEKYVLREIEQTDYFKKMYEYILKNNIIIKPYEIITQSIDSEENLEIFLEMYDKYNPLYKQFLHKIIEYRSQKYVVYHIYKNEGSLNCYLYDKKQVYIINGLNTINIKPDVKDVKLSAEQDEYLENENYLNAIHFLFRTVKLINPEKSDINTRWCVYDINKRTGLLKCRNIKNINDPIKYFDTPTENISYKNVELAS